MSKKKSRPSAAPAPESPLAPYAHLLDESAQAALLDALAQHPTRAVRVNTLKLTPTQAETAWATQYGWQMTRVPFCESGWTITGGESVGQTLAYRMGHYYIQDAASMLPAELFDWDEPAPLVLDMAAAPGGKTTHLISKMGDRGLLLANDSSANRLATLRAVLRDWSASNAAVVNHYGETLGRQFPETFDKVLLDAPCSMDNFHTEMRPVTPNERAQLSKRQAALLRSALQAVRVGGEIVYATCTLSPDENEAVIDGLLREFAGAVTLKAVQTRLPVPAHGLVADGERGFHPDMQEAIRLWPHLYQTSGFFSAALIKTARVATDSNSSKAPSGGATMDKFHALARRYETALYSAMDDYGFDLASFLDEHQLTLYRLETRIFALPERFVRDFSHVHASQVGMMVADMQDNAVIPSHELVSRFATDFTGRRYRVGNEDVLAWLAGEAIPNTSARDGVAFLEDASGYFIGVGWAGPKQIVNLLPKRVVR